MKSFLLNINSKLFLPLMLILGIPTSGFAQTISLSTGCTTAPTADEFQFDVFVTNTGASSIQFNSAVVRLTHSAAILAGGTNTLVFSYVSGSDFPNVWPPVNTPTFLYNTGSRLMSVSTSTSVYLNGGGCAAPNIAPAETKKIGRFSLKNTAQNFVPGSSVGLIWSTSGMVGYINCAVGSTTFNVGAGNTVLQAPCALTIPAGCTSPTVNGNPSDQSVCTNGIATFTGSFTGGSPTPTTIWQVQTGGIGAFNDLTEAAPYSGTATNTLTITNPNISLSTNRYRMKAVTSGCTDVFTNSALLTVNIAANAGVVSGTSPVCISNTATYTSNGDPGGTWSSTNTGVATVDAAGLVTPVSVGTTDITYTVNAGCGSPVSSFKTLTVAEFTVLAGAAGGPEVCSNAIVQPGGSSFSDGACSLIAKVVPSGALPVSGSVNTCVLIEDVVHTYQSTPYLQRIYNIEPATNPATSTATITLYYTQGEFDAYNLARGTYPSLPINAGDLAGINNIRLTQFHGTGTNPGNYTGLSELIDPVDANIIWNATGSGRWEVSFNITGFSGFYLSTSTTPLPVTIVNFSGRNNGNYNILSWATSSEQNSNYFEIQRSLNGVSYTDAGRINAAGNSSTTKNYTYSDNITGINATLYYYRLRMVDITGYTKFSDVVKIRTNSKGFYMEATPNPFADQLKINVETEVAETATISLKDINGKNIRQKQSQLRKGNNALQLNDLANLPAGVYLLAITTDTQHQTIKVIKQ